MSVEPAGCFAAVTSTPADAWVGLEVILPDGRGFSITLDLVELVDDCDILEAEVADGERQADEGRMTSFLGTVAFTEPTRHIDIEQVQP